MFGYWCALLRHTVTKNCLQRIALYFDVFSCSAREFVNSRRHLVSAVQILTKLPHTLGYLGKHFGKGTAHLRLLSRFNWCLDGDRPCVQSRKSKYTAEVHSHDITMGVVPLFHPCVHALPCLNPA